MMFTRFRFLLHFFRLTGSLRCEIAIIHILYMHMFLAPGRENDVDGRSKNNLTMFTVCLKMIYVLTLFSPHLSQARLLLKIVCV